MKSALQGSLTSFFDWWNFVVSNVCEISSNLQEVLGAIWIGRSERVLKLIRKEIPFQVIYSNGHSAVYFLLLF